MGVFADQVRHGKRGAEFDVGFVDDHYALVPGRLQHGQQVFPFQHGPGGIVGRTEEDHLHRFAGFQGRQDSRHVGLEIIQRRHFANADATGLGIV